MTHYVATITVFIVIAAMAFGAERADRYQRLADHADAGLGADEFEGPPRYTRSVDRQKEARDRTAKHLSRANQITIASQQRNPSHAV